MRRPFLRAPSTHLPACAAESAIVLPALTIESGRIRAYRSGFFSSLLLRAEERAIYARV